MNPTLLTQKVIQFKAYILENIEEKEEIIKVTNAFYEECIKITPEPETYTLHKQIFALLYIVFHLLDDKRRTKCEDRLRKILKKILKLHQQAVSDCDNSKLTTEKQQVLLNLKKLRDFYAKLVNSPCEDIIEFILLLEETDPAPQKLLILTQYCFSKMQAFDMVIDEQITYMVQAYFRHNHKPKSYFHTDKVYILDYMAQELYLERETDNSYFDRFAPKTDHTTKVINKYYFLAEDYLKDVQFSYSLRNIYPKPNFTDMQKLEYYLESLVFG